MAGWICLHRDIQEHWLFNFDEPDKFMAWCDLLLSANHEDKKFMVKGRLVECRRGQVAMSQVTLQKRWNMSQNKLKRFLVLLKNDGMIELETNELTTLITICNYSKFQDNERPDERPEELAGERTTDEQANDKQQCKQLQQEEIKEINKEKINDFILPDWVCRDTWDLWMKTRKGKKMVSEQKRAQVEKLQKWKDAGLDYGYALSESAVNGWQGLFKPKNLNNQPESRSTGGYDAKKTTSTNTGFAKKYASIG